jgi:hypothetical protein
VALALSPLVLPNYSAPSYGELVLLSSSNNKHTEERWRKNFKDKCWRGDFEDEHWRKNFKDKHWRKNFRDKHTEERWRKNFKDKHVNLSKNTGERTSWTNM